MERKPNRLKNYDYSRTGAYFITICTHKHVHLFGEINNGIMKLNDFGKIADDLWTGLPKKFDKIILDIYIIMPNHIHGIIAITEDITDSPVGNATVRKSKSLKPTFSENDFLNSQNIAELHSPQNAGYKRTKMHLSKIIQAYKAEVTRRIKRISHDNIKSSIWQRSFYDRIIRNEKEFYNIQQYIYENPARWAFDKGNLNLLIPDNVYYNSIFSR